MLWCFIHAMRFVLWGPFDMFRMKTSTRFGSEIQAGGCVDPLASAIAFTKPLDLRCLGSLSLPYDDQASKSFPCQISKRWHAHILYLQGALVNKRAMQMERAIE